MTSLDRESSFVCEIDEQQWIVLISYEREIIKCISSSRKFSIEADFNYLIGKYKSPLNRSKIIEYIKDYMEEKL